MIERRRVEGRGWKREREGVRERMREREREIDRRGKKEVLIREREIM